MFITENQNLADSVLFLLSARQTLADIVEASGAENHDSMIKFLHNEASDYEVMNLLITGKMPEEKYNHIAEIRLFSILKEQMLRDHTLVTEAIGEDVYQNVIHEVDSVFPTMSTAGPVLEFMAMQDRDVAFSYYLSEIGKDAIEKGIGYVSGKAGDIAKAAKGAGETVAKAASGAFASAKDAVMNTGWPALKAFANSPQGQIVGGAAMAALVGYAAMKTYKNFFSKAAKSCAGQADKKLCMNKFKKQAIMKQAADMQRGVGVCAKVKNPEKCKAGIGKKIAGLKAKASKIAG